MAIPSKNKVLYTQVPTMYCVAYGPDNKQLQFT